MDRIAAAGLKLGNLALQVLGIRGAGCKHINVFQESPIPTWSL